MKVLKYLAIAMLPLLAACSQEEEVLPQGSEVEVTFNTVMPEMITRAEGTNDLGVDRVVCAVFNHDNTQELLRETIEIGAEGTITYSPRLVIGQTYNVVFWAMKGENYNVTNLANVTRKDNVAEVDAEAFTAHKTITVDGNSSQSVTLTRPLAQLNIGTTAEDVAAVKALGLTPTGIVVTVSNVAPAYNAIEGKAVVNTEKNEQATYTLTIPADATLSVNEIDYTQLATCYLFAAGNADVVNFDIMAGTEKICTRTISNAPLGANHRTNIVGSLMTGTTTWEISFEKEYKETTNSEVK